MRVFVYEFVTGGGQFSIDAAATTSSLLVEGRAMARAVTADFARLPGVHVCTTRDGRVAPFHHQACSVIELGTLQEEQRTICELSQAADWTLVIAPEICQLLECRVTRLLGSSARLLSPDKAVVSLASDKQATAEHLAARDVPCPAGEVVGRFSSPPADLFPAVIKPNDGCGSVGVRKLDSVQEFRQHVRNDSERASWRLERFVPGMAASVAVLCGPRDLVALPACEQVLSKDGCFRYGGGKAPMEASLDGRARQLALAAARTLPAPQGYIGFDLVLGEAGDGSDDYVIEINPRLTTSYLGLRALCRTNLAAAMLAVVQGKPPALSWRDGVVEFSPDGEIEHTRCRNTEHSSIPERLA